MKKETLYKDIFFIVIIFLLSIFIYNGTRHFVELPYGVHQWRQSMNYSMIQNYQEPDRTFWKPAIDNLLNPNITGDLVLEFPVFQWLCSFLPRDYFPYFRWLVYIVSFIGLFYSYKFAYKIFNNYFFAISSVLIIFFIPIFLYYNANFFTDVPSVMLGICATYFWYEALIRNNDNNKIHIKLIVGTFFFTLSGLLRIVSIILPIAFFIYYVFYLFKNNKSFLFYFFIGLVIIVLWYIYQQKNNMTYEVLVPPKSSIFFCKIDDIKEILYNLRDLVFNQLGFVFGKIISYLIIFFIVFLHWKNYSTFLKFLFLFSMVGSFLYIILWFKSFPYHDYYMLPILPFLFISVIIVFIALSEYIQKKQLNILIILLLLMSFYHGYENYRLRDFRGWYGWNLHETRFEEGLLWWFHMEDDNKWSKIRRLSKNLDTLEQAGIHKKDTVICNFDPTPTYVLSLLQLKGWALTNEGGKMDRFEQYQNYINHGAKYLIHYGDDPAVTEADKDSLLRKYKVFEYHNIKFYKIDYLRQK